MKTNFRFLLNLKTFFFMLKFQIAISDLYSFLILSNKFQNTPLETRINRAFQSVSNFIENRFFTEKNKNVFFQFHQKAKLFLTAKKIFLFSLINSGKKDIFYSEKRYFHFAIFGEKSYFLVRFFKSQFQIYSLKTYF